MPSLNNIQQCLLIESMKQEENEINAVPLEFLNDLNDDFFEDDFDPFYDPFYDDSDDDDDIEPLNIPQVIVNLIETGLITATGFNILEEILMLEDILTLEENERRNIYPTSVADLNVENKLLRELSGAIADDDSTDYDDTIDDNVDYTSTEDDSIEDGTIDDYENDLSPQTLITLKQLFTEMGIYKEIKIDTKKLKKNIDPYHIKDFEDFEDLFISKEKCFNPFDHGNRDKFITPKQIVNTTSFRNYNYLRSLRGFLDELISNDDDMENG